MEASKMTSMVEEQPLPRSEAETAPRRAWVTPRVERISTSDTQTSTTTYRRSDGVYGAS